MYTSRDIHTWSYLTMLPVHARVRRNSPETGVSPRSGPDGSPGPDKGSHGSGQGRGLNKGKDPQRGGVVQ